MRILVDVNVFIDVLTKRAHWDGSVRVLNLVRHAPEIEGYVSALTVPILYFFRLRVAEEMQSRIDAQAAVKGFNLIALTERIVQEALTSALPDFEDNIQLASAEAVTAEYLITRNQRHYQTTALPIVTPEEFLAMEPIAALEARLHH